MGRWVVCCTGSHEWGRSCPPRRRALYGETLPLRHLSPPVPEQGPPGASQRLAYASSAGNRLALVARETQAILSPGPGRGTWEPFPVNEAVVCSLLSHSPLVWAERKGEDSP